MTALYGASDLLETTGAVTRCKRRRHAKRDAAVEFLVGFLPWMLLLWGIW